MGEEGVAATNSDATLCKYQAVIHGYYKDEFIQHFLTSRTKSTGPKKAPEINRGYFARSASMAFLVENFIERYHSKCQIINFGAGFDTLYWRLKTDSNSKNFKHIKYIEVDLSLVTVQKLMAIRRHPQLLSHLNDVQYSGEELHSENYHLISFDLRNTDKERFKQKLSADCNVDFDMPTLCISECVLVYMPMSDSSQMISWMCENFTNFTIINYEQCNMNDRFGKIMLDHMTARHCDLLGVEACDSLDTQISRFKTKGLVHSNAWTLLDIYRHLLAREDVQRIEHLEFLDERELLEQLLQHYCIVLATNNESNLLPEDSVWKARCL